MAPRVDWEEHSGVSVSDRMLLSIQRLPNPEIGTKLINSARVQVDGSLCYLTNL